MKTLLLILALPLLVQAQSVKEGEAITKWTLMGESEFAKLYYAPDSIARREDMIKVWIKVDLPSGSDVIDYKLRAGRNFGSIRAFGILRCQDSAFHSPALVLYYDRNGKLVKRQKEPEIVRNDDGANGLTAIFTYFCENVEVPPTGPPRLKPRLP